MSAIQPAVGMLLVGAIILLAAVALDNHIEARRRKRMDAWRRKKDQ